MPCIQSCFNVDVLIFWEYNFLRHQAKLSNYDITLKIQLNNTIPLIRVLKRVTLVSENSQPLTYGKPDWWPIWTCPNLHLLKFMIGGVNLGPRLGGDGPKRCTHHVKVAGCNSSKCTKCMHSGFHQGNRSTMTQMHALTCRLKEIGSLYIIFNLTYTHLQQQ